jgi:MFS family permease
VRSVRLRERLGPLSERDFRMLWIGQSVSGLGDSMALIGLAFGVLKISHSASDLGVVMAVWVTSRCGLTLVAGVWADRLKRQWIMVGSDLARGAAQAAIAVLLLTGAARIWQVIVLTCFYGAADSFFGPAQTGLVPATVSAGRLQQANALLELSRNTAAVAGPGLAGLIVAAAGPGAAFAADSASFFVSAVVLSMLRVPIMKQPAEQPSFLAELRQGWAEVASRTWVWVTIAYFAIMNVATSALFVLGPVVALRSLGGARAWGLVGSAATIGSVAGGLAALRIKPSRPLLAGTIALAAISLEPAFLARPLPLWLIMAAAVAGFAGVSFDTALWLTALQEHVPEQSLSRVSSYDWLGSFAFQPLGYLAAGSLAIAVGVGRTLLGSAVLILASSVVVALVPDIRRLRSRSAATAAPVRVP